MYPKVCVNWKSSDFDLIFCENYIYLSWEFFLMVTFLTLNFDNFIKKAMKNH